MSDHNLNSSEKKCGIISKVDENNATTSINSKNIFKNFFKIISTKSTKKSNRTPIIPEDQHYNEQGDIKISLIINDHLKVQRNELGKISFVDLHKENYKQKLIDIDEYADVATNVNETSYENISKKICNVFNTRYIAMSPSLYIHKIDKTLDKTVLDGLNELVNLMCIVNKSEENVIDAISNYIKDSSFKNDLVTSLRRLKMFRITFDTKSEELHYKILESHYISEDHYIQKLEGNIKHLVFRNRLLEKRNENLYKTNEKLLARLKTKSINKRRRFKHRIPKTKNKRLYDQIDLFRNAVVYLENELILLQNDNCKLVWSIRCLKRDHLRALENIKKIKLDTTLEVAQTKENEYKNDRTMYQLRGIIYKLLDDLEKIQAHVKLEFSFDFETLQKNDFSILELMSAFKSSFYEISRLLIDVNNKYKNSIVNVDSLREANLRLQDSLRKSTIELDILSTKLEQNTLTQTDTKDLLLNYDIKLKEVMEMQTIINNLNIEKTELKKDILNFKHKISYMKIDIKKIAEENFQLCMELDNRNDTPPKSETTIIVKKYNSLKDNIEKLQTKYNQILEDKNRLHKLVEDLTKNYEILMDQQKLCSIQIDLNQEVIEITLKENEYLKRQLTIEHDTIKNLKSERVRHLKEKNILRAVFNQLQSELLYVRELEGTVANMNQETSRLTMIAVYNKELGEKLKCEVELRDHAIVKLQNDNMNINAELKNNDNNGDNTIESNNNENQNIEGNTYNCIETNEIQTALEYLKEHLPSEFKNKPLTLFKELKKTDRATLRELFKEFRDIVTQRDELLLIEKQNKLEIAELKETLKVHDVQNTEQDLMLEDNKNDIEFMKQKVGDKEQEIIDLKNKIEANSLEITELKAFISQQEQQKEELNSTITYLKNNSQKLYSDINEIRKKEKEARDLYNSVVAERNFFEEENIKLAHENETLRYQVEYLAELSEKIDSAIKRKDSKKRTENTEKHLTDQTKECNKLDEKVFVLYKENETLKQNYKEKIQYRDDCEKQISYVNTVQVKKQMDKKLNYFMSKYDKTESELKNAKNEISRLKKKVTELETDNTKYRQLYLKNEKAAHSNHLQYINVKAENERIIKQVLELTEIIDNQQEIYNTLNVETKDKLAKQHKLLDEKEECINDLRNQLVNADKVIKESQKENDRVKEQISHLMIVFHQKNYINNVLSQEQENLNKILNDTEMSYQEIHNNYLTLEKELTTARDNLSQVSKTMEVFKAKYEETLTALTKTNNELSLSHDNVKGLKEEILQNQNRIISLKEELFAMQEQVTRLEFQKYELSLQLYETRVQLETEKLLVQNNIQEQNSPPTN